MAIQDTDLLAAYAVYLVVAFAVGLVMRVRAYVAAVSLFWDFRARLPRLYSLMVGHVRLFLAWPHLAAMAVALVVLTTHLVLFQLVFRTAVVRPSDLASIPAAAVIVSLAILGMLILDIYDLAVVERPIRRSIPARLFLAERALSAAEPVSSISRGIMSRWMRKKILNANMRKRAQQKASEGAG